MDLILILNTNVGSLSALFNGVYGNDIANGMLLQLDNAEGLDQLRNILPGAYNNAWRARHSV